MRATSILLALAGPAPLFALGTPSQAKAPIDPARNPLADAPLEVHPGERVDPALYGPGYVESIEQALEREQHQGEPPPQPDAMPGVWATPSPRTVTAPRSGERNVMNLRGDTRMGIGFPRAVELAGVWVGGQAAAGVWPPALRAVGYRDGVEVGATDWFTEVGAEPRWFAIGLAGIDRVVFDAQPAFGNVAWYTLDDLTYSYVLQDALGGPPRTKHVVVDFEDCEWRQTLTGTRYAGLSWESGTGFEREVGIHAPRILPGVDDDLLADDGQPSGSFLGGSGTPPQLVSQFQAIKRGDHSSSTYPPDTCGSVGPSHFVEVINRVFAVYDKTSGVKLVGMNLGTFLPGSNGDPRVHYDPHSGRWFVLVTDFQMRIYLAVSLSGNPTGSWFKTSFVISSGSDSGCWPDYPTLGVDANGIYSGSYMVGCSSMTLVAIDKAPLIAATPSLGTVTAFRNLSYERALQPCLTYGNPGVQFVVSTSGNSSIRIRRVSPPLTNPTLATVATLNVGSHPNPPNAPALGSGTPINTVDKRLMNAVYRDGSIWTAHSVSQSGRAAARWYQLGTAPYAMLQKGTVSDPVLHYFMPGISVNAAGDVVLGFSGSYSGQYVGAYYTGRRAADLPNEMAPPVQYRAGQAPQNNIDGAGRNRWGDYSLSSIDPTDDLTLWTIQQYAHADNVWGTEVAQLRYDAPGGGECPSPVAYCVTTPNSVGSGMLMGHVGTPEVSTQDFTLMALGGPPGQAGIFYYGPDQAQAPFGDGMRCVSPGAIGTFRLPVVQIDLFGDASYGIQWDQPPACCGPGALASGTEYNFQFWYRDPQGGPAGFNLSNGLQVLFCE